jgi:hypothetical protein
MTYYTASLFYRSDHIKKSSDKNSIWEERIVLIKADSSHRAMEIAQKYGESESVKYKNVSGESVEWVFVKIESVYKIIDNMQAEIAEVFSRFLNDREAKSILQPLE